ncbi:dTDP-glucose 4,6-dehydratase [Corynebacterium heidelbergense]|uniref:dTDP-glucose 4,6-dehydratase n=1 Tax=Corynebacterium heidelbergense TaxID=2055947 RepID=A0A364V9W3_9CORY|nr:dTDP-glucose 4,6-dehydratase [Corynebacterium heidelbergense]RAV33356.1 dTDP-glucose 4,6-dehydratase [Corynebacterium heidelbergense]
MTDTPATPAPGRTHSDPRSFSTLIVTGGAGFIGSNFVHRSLRQRPDLRIHIVDAMTYASNPANLCADNGAPLAEVYGRRVGFTRADVADSHAVDDIVAAEVERADGPVGIVHFAAESHNDNSLRDPAIFARSNVEGTVNVARAAVAHGVHLHHISTDEVFGDLALDDPQRFTPDTPYRPSSPYSASKASADHFVRAFVRSLGLSATISNCSNNYGPRQHPEKFIPRQITGLIDGEKPRLYGAGHNVRDWIHVDDHNDAVWAILERGAAGRTYLIGADGERSNRQVVGDLLEAFGKDPRDFVHVTDRSGHARRYAIDPSSVRELGWVPRYNDFAAGLAETIRWYREHEQWWREARRAAEAGYRHHEKVLAQGGA